MANLFNLMLGLRSYIVVLHLTQGPTHPNQSYDVDQMIILLPSANLLLLVHYDFVTMWMMIQKLNPYTTNVILLLLIPFIQSFIAQKYCTKLLKKVTLGSQ